MRDFGSPGGLLAVGVLTGLVWAAAAPRLAAEAGAATPDFSSSNAAWVFGTDDFIAIPGEPSPTRNDPAHAYVSNDDFAPPESSRHTGSPIFRIPTSSRGRRRS